MRADKLLTKYVLPVALCLCTASFASAARLLKATVELDGKTVMESAYGCDDYAEAPEVWRLLGKEPFGMDTSLQVPVQPEDAVQTRLQGSVVIRIRHVDRPIVQAQASELTLIRKSPSSDKWYLPEEEVERIAQANGIPKPPPPPSTGSIIWVLVIVAAFLVAGIGIGAWLVIRFWRNSFIEETA